MSLRDRLRALRPAAGTDDQPDAGGAAPDGESVAVPPAGTAAPHGAARTDVTDFDPRADGDYHCADAALILRFARPAVTESSAGGSGGPASPEATAGGSAETAAAAVAAPADPAVGEFTSSGRFVVQRPFGRPVVYTVLELRADSFTARRTDTATAGTAELVFTFEPDGPAAAM